MSWGCSMLQHATIEVIRGQIRRLMADFGGEKANFGGRGFLVFLSSTLARSPYISPNIFCPFFGTKILSSSWNLLEPQLYQNQLTNPPIGRLYWPIMSKPMVNMVSLDQ